MVDLDKLRKLHKAVIARDNEWMHELVKRFGRDAKNRRYDYDRTGHPAEANAAYAKLDKAQKEFNAAGGYGALFARPE